jgi:hypothetical protein
LTTFESLHILGCGQLTEELLPWFSDKKTVYVHGRHVEKKSKLAREFSYVQLVPLTSAGLSDQAFNTALVVAAPMKASEIQRWAGQHSFSKILDLRGESRIDPIKGLKEVVNLKDFYQNLESHQAQVRDKVDAARAEIERLSGEKGRMAELRPFGWDDLCA